MNNKTVGGVLLFGSRTHYSYGYQPKKNSDLDVFVFKKSCFYLRTGQFEETLHYMQTSFRYPESKEKERTIFDLSESSTS